MRWRRLCLQPTLLCLLLVLPAAPGQQPTEPTERASSAESIPEPKADPAAMEALDRAIKELDPKETGWIETNIWGRGELEGVLLHVNGRYLAGPGQRLRTELNTILGDVPARQKVVCDGRKFWESFQYGANEPSVRMTDMGRLRAALAEKRALKGSQILSESFLPQFFRGLQPFLQTLREQMKLTHVEPARWNGLEATKLTGVWFTSRLSWTKTGRYSHDLSRDLSGSKEDSASLKNWPAHQPRECHLYLGAGSPHWPYRVEWWVFSPLQQSNVLLLEMEFRDPRLQRTLPEERMAREFSFDPGGAPVTDVTKEVLDFIDQRAERLNKGQR
jgi:hypothetical protein